MRKKRGVYTLLNYSIIQKKKSAQIRFHVLEFFKSVILSLFFFVTPFVPSTLLGLLK